MSAPEDPRAPWLAHVATCAVCKVSVGECAEGTPLRDAAWAETERQRRAIPLTVKLSDEDAAQLREIHKRALARDHGKEN